MSTVPRLNLHSVDGDQVNVHILEASRSPRAYRVALRSNPALNRLHAKLAGVITNLGPDCNIMFADGSPGPRLFVQARAAPYILNHLETTGYLEHTPLRIKYLGDMRPRHIIVESEWVDVVLRILNAMNEDLRIRPKELVQFCVRVPHISVNRTFIENASPAGSEGRASIASSGANNRRITVQARKRLRVEESHSQSASQHTESQSTSQSLSQSQASSSLSSQRRQMQGLTTSEQEIPEANPTSQTQSQFPDMGVFEEGVQPAGSAVHEQDHECQIVSEMQMQDVPDEPQH